VNVLGEAFRRSVERSRQKASSAETVRSRPVRPAGAEDTMKLACPPAQAASGAGGQAEGGASGDPFEFLRRARRVATFAEGPLAPGCDILAGLRSAVFSAGLATPPATILVTGPSRSSGKTAVAAGLAGELARDLLYRVLLVDADIRRPGVAALLQVDTELDLADVLEGRSEAAEAVVYSEGDNLSVLALRAGSRLSAETLASAASRELFSMLRQAFDYVVIDAGDTASSAVPRVLASGATGTVLVLPAGVTRERARESAAAIRSAGGKVVGVVLTGAPRR